VMAHLVVDSMALLHAIHKTVKALGLQKEQTVISSNIKLVKTLMGHGL